MVDASGGLQAHLRRVNLDRLKVVTVFIGAQSLLFAPVDVATVGPDAPAFLLPALLAVRSEILLMCDSNTDGWISVAEAQAAPASLRVPTGIDGAVLTLCSSPWRRRC